MAYKNHRIIDLSQEIYNGMPVFVGHPETKIWKNATHEETVNHPDFLGEMSYESHVLQFCDHGPTHVDSISHIDPRPGAPSIDESPIDWFYTDAICLDFTGVPERSYITKEMVQKELERTGLDIREGDTFLFTTGNYRKYYPRPEYLTQYAGLSQDAAEYIYRDCGAINIGADAPSIDNAADRSFPCHIACRRYQRLNTENLCNLEEVVGQRFLFIGLPLKIREGTGSPIRAVAVLGA